MMLLFMDLWLANPEVKKGEWKNSSKKNQVPYCEKYDVSLDIDSILQIKKQ